MSFKMPVAVWLKNRPCDVKYYVVRYLSLDDKYKPFPFLNRHFCEQSLCGYWSRWQFFSLMADLNNYEVSTRGIILRIAPTR